MKMESIDDQTEDLVDYYLDGNSFEDFLENFDITPTEVFMILYREGHIDETILNELLLGGRNE